jgi:hypothetical protein
MDDIRLATRNMPYVVFVDRTDATFNVARVMDVNVAHVKVLPLIFNENSDMWETLEATEEVELGFADVIGVTTLVNKRLSEQEQRRFAGAVTAVTSPFVIAMDFRNGKNARAAQLLTIFPKVTVKFTNEESPTTLESLRHILATVVEPVVTQEHTNLAASRFAAKEQREVTNLFDDIDEPPSKVRVRAAMPTAKLSVGVAMDLKKWPELAEKPEQQAQFTHVWREWLQVQTGGEASPGHVLRDYMLATMESLMLLTTNTHTEASAQACLTNIFEKTRESLLILKVLFTPSGLISNRLEFSETVKFYASKELPADVESDMKAITVRCAASRKLPQASAPPQDPAPKLYFRPKNFGQHRGGGGRGY